MAEGSLKNTVLVAQEKLEKGDIENALERFRTAVTLCNEQQVPAEKKLPCLANAGACMVTLGQYQESLESLNEALQLVSLVYSEQTDNAHTTEHTTALSNQNLSEEGLSIKGDLTYNLASSYIGLQEYQQAAGFIKISIDCYIKLGRTYQAAEGFLVLARCEKHNGQIEAELQSLKSARQLFSDLGADDKEGTVLGEMLLLLMACKRGNGELEKCMGSAKLVSLRMGSKREKGHLLMKLGIVKAAQRSFEEALLHLKESLPLVRSARDKEADAVYYEASVLQNIGAIYNELSEFDESLPFHEEAVKLHGEFGSVRAEAKSLCNQSLAEVKLEHWSEAEGSMDRALQKAIETGDLETQFQAHEGLGCVFYRAEKLDEAKRHFELALLSLEKIGGNIGLIRERVLEKMADVIESQIKLKEKRLNIDGDEETDGIDTSPNWFSSGKHLPPLTTSTPLVAHSTFTSRYRTKLPPLNLEEEDELDGLYDPTRRQEPPIVEQETPDIELNFTAKSTLQEIVIFDHKKKALASEHELERTLKSVTEVLTPITTANTVSTNGDVFAYSYSRDVHIQQAFTSAVEGESQSRSQIKQKPNSPQHDEDLQKAYIDTYAYGDSDLSVSVTPDSFTEEDNIDVSDEEPPNVAATTAANNTDVSTSAGSQPRVREGSLALGEDTREKFVATPGAPAKKLRKKKRSKEPIKLKSKTTGEDEPDYSPPSTNDSTVATNSKVCGIL
jgi:tetratricopeptide (TPR) repeat protein